LLAVGRQVEEIKIDLESLQKLSIDDGFDQLGKASLLFSSGHIQTFPCSFPVGDAQIFLVPSLLFV